MVRADDLSSGMDMMDLGDMPGGGPGGFPGGRPPFGGPGAVRASDGAEGEREARGDRDGRGGGGFRFRRSRGPDSIPGED
jgi:hypothetical protein